MGGEARFAQAEDAVTRWADATLDLGAPLEVHALPQLSTPRYVLVGLLQPGSRTDADLHALWDGRAVLPSSAGALASVLVREGLMDDPAALPAALVAELWLRLAEPGRGRPLLDTGARSTPPRALRDGDAVAITFWSERSHGGPVERWTLRLHADGTLEGAATPGAGE